MLGKNKKNEKKMLPEFNLTTEEFKKLRSVKPLPIEQPIYFQYNGNVYACQHFDGFPDRYYYNRKGELVKAETSIDHFPRTLMDELKNVWGVEIKYGTFLDSIIFKYDVGWNLVYCKKSDGTKLVSDFDYNGDNDFIKKCL